MPITSYEENIMRFFNLLLKGMAVGVSNVIPGVSAGTLLVLLGIYDELVEAVGNFLTNKSRRKDYFLFLLPLVIGAAGGVLAFANLITLLLERYAAPMQFLFIGLVLGGIPTVLKMHHDMRPSMPRVVAFVLGLGLVVLLALGEQRGIRGHFSAGTTSLLALSLFAVVGFFAGGAMVTPGVSGAYIFLLTGTYEPIMQALASLTQPPIHWGVIVAVAVGAGLGILICSRLIDLALKRQPALTFYAILGLICGSLVGLWPAEPDISVFSLTSILPLVSGAAIAYLLGRQAGHGPPK
jgi:putative membrane protein